MKWLILFNITILSWVSYEYQTIDVFLFHSILIWLLYKQFCDEYNFYWFWPGKPVLSQFMRIRSRGPLPEDFSCVHKGFGVSIVKNRKRYIWVLCGTAVYVANARLVETVISPPDDIDKNIFSFDLFYLYDRCIEDSKENNGKSSKKDNSTD